MSVCAVPRQLGNHYGLLRPAAPGVGMAQPRMCISRFVWDVCVRFSVEYDTNKNLTLKIPRSLGKKAYTRFMQNSAREYYIHTKHFPKDNGVDVL